MDKHKISFFFFVFPLLSFLHFENLTLMLVSFLRSVSKFLTHNSCTAEVCDRGFEIECNLFFFLTNY